MILTEIKIYGTIKKLKLVMNFEFRYTISNNYKSTTMTNMENNFGRKHIAPDAYPYCLRIPQIDQGIGFMSLLHSYCTKYSSIGNHYTPNGSPIISDGYNEIMDKQVFVINQMKQGYYYIYFKSKNDADEIYNNLLDIHKKKEFVRQNPIYKFNRMHSQWVQVSSYQQKNSIDFIGYHHYLNLIIKDIDNYVKHSEFLKSIGEGYRTMNYLLFGPPGVGKTTLIKTLASIKNFPIYIVSATNFDSAKTLNPVNQAYPLKIILIEDFDRCLEDPKHNMSEILNSLDGIETSEGCIRFFTANNADIILNNKALINRMNSKFEFYYPNKEQFVNKINRLLTIKTDVDEDKKNKFIDSVVEKENITIRSFTNYIIRYLFDEDYLDKMIYNITEL